MRALVLGLLACAAIPSFAQTRVTPGQLLVATERIRDPDFSKSVILIVNTDRRGVQGIWINRPTSVPVSAVFPGSKSDALVYQGGPLRIGTNGLTRAARQPEGSVKFFGDVWLISDQPTLKKLAETDAGLRIYVGTCGWSVAQLDDEIGRRGSWTILPATAGAVFDDDPGTLWDRLTGRNVAADYRKWRRSPHPQSGTHRIGSLAGALQRLRETE